MEMSHARSPSLKRTNHSVPNVIRCYYKNNDHNWQIIRLPEPKHYWEKTLFPGQSFEFQAPATAWLEIHTGEEDVCATLQEKIPCSRLWVDATAPSGIEKHPCPNDCPPLLPDGNKQPICKTHPETALQKLSVQINQEEQQYREALNNLSFYSHKSAIHAWKLGNYLLEAQTILPRGKWEEWLVQCCPTIPPRTARYYKQNSKKINEAIEGGSVTVAALLELPLKQVVREITAKVRQTSVFSGQHSHSSSISRPRNLHREIEKSFALIAQQVNTLFQENWQTVPDMDLEHVLNQVKLVEKQVSELHTILQSCTLPENTAAA